MPLLHSSQLMSSSKIQPLIPCARRRRAVRPSFGTHIRFLLLSAVFCLSLSQCTTIDPARKEGIRRVVVATNVGNEVTRHQVGLTAFGNKTVDPIQDSRLRAGVIRILKEELQGKFPEVIVVNEEPPMDSPNLFKSIDYRTWGKDLARKHQADAVFVVAGRYHYPYVAPSYMTAQGLGLWHFGKDARIECFTWNWLMDAEGKSLGHYSRYFTGQQLPAIGFEEHFPNYSPADQERIISRCLDEFRVEISSFVKGIGL